MTKAPTSGLSGGPAAVGLTFFLALPSRRSAATLILSGMLVSAFFASLVSLLKFVADPSEKLPGIVVRIGDRAAVIPGAVLGPELIR